MITCLMCGQPTNRKALTRIPLETRNTHQALVSRSVLCAQCHHGLTQWHKTDTKKCEAAMFSPARATGRDTLFRLEPKTPTPFKFEA